MDSTALLPFREGWVRMVITPMDWNEIMEKQLCHHVLGLREGLGTVPILSAPLRPEAWLPENKRSRHDLVSVHPR